MKLTRREWAAGLLTAAGCARASDRPIGLNLYTVREPLAEDPERTLREVAAAGCSYVEARLRQLEGQLVLLDELRMPWVSWMIETPLVTGAWDAWELLMKRIGVEIERSTLDATIETAVRHGVKNIGISFTLPAEREGPDGWERLAEKLNRAGEACRKAGLRFYFHNHAEEFVGTPGKRPFDRLLQSLDPDLVSFEIDVFWVSIAGSDPAEAIRSAGGRVLSLHLKDKAEGTADVETTFAAPLKATCEVGAGVLDWAAILQAADEAGVTYLFVEQDETRGDPLGAVQWSFAYLSSL